MSLLQFHPPKKRLRHTTFLIRRSEVGALHVFVAEDCLVVITKLMRRRRRQSRYQLSPWTAGSLGNPRTAHTTHSQCLRDRKSRGIWSQPIPSKGVHPHPARALMDLDFMGYKRIVLKSDLEPSIDAFCDMVGTARLCPKLLPMARARVTGIGERSGLESLWNLDVRCCLCQLSIVPIFSLLFHKGEPHDGHTAHMRLKGKPWRVEMPSFGECVGYGKHTRHKLESRWSSENN